MSKQKEMFWRRTITEGGHWSLNPFNMIFYNKIQRPESGNCSKLAVYRHKIFSSR